MAEKGDGLVLRVEQEKTPDSGDFTAVDLMVHIQTPEGRYTDQQLEAFPLQGIRGITAVAFGATSLVLDYLQQSRVYQNIIIPRSTGFDQKILITGDFTKSDSEESFIEVSNPNIHPITITYPGFQRWQTTSLEFAPSSNGRRIAMVLERV